MKFIRKTGVLLIAIMFTWIVLPCYAETAQEKEIVKVGYFNVGGYFSLDENGQLQGYDVEYLKEISKYTGLEFEYVDCGTWTNAVEKMGRHEVDLVGATQWSAKREPDFEYCLNHHGFTIGEIVSLPDSDILYEDYDSIDKMRIGCLSNYVHYDEMTETMEEHQASPEIIYYETQAELIHALEEKEVDGIATYAHIVDQSYKVIEKYSYAPIYFISWKGNTDLTDRIDKAIAQIEIEHPEFDDDLLKSEFPTMNQSSLTKDEQDYLNSIDSLTFCFCTNEGYLCRTQDGKYQGINPAIAKKICEILGITYKEVQFDFANLVKELSSIQDSGKSNTALVDRVKSMGIDVWGDFYYDRAWADKIGVIISEPYLDAGYYQIRRKNSQTDQDRDRIVAVRGLRYTSEIVNQYAADQVVWCDDFEECIRAVNKGEADVTVINTFAAEYYLAMYQYNNLTATLTDFSNQSCMALVDDPDGMLASILSKTIKSIPTEEMDVLIRKETAVAPEQNVVMAFIYANTMEAVIIMGIGLIILFTTVFLSSM